MLDVGESGTSVVVDEIVEGGQLLIAQKEAYGDELLHVGLNRKTHFVQIAVDWHRQCDCLRHV